MFDQVIAQIRFQLDQLSSHNAHHDFEHLCRHLARKRICSNILPATGPVSAGGDQGRDFETFRTYLSNLATNCFPFIGLASDKTIVFACSIQKEKLPGKIKDDVNSILSQGTKVDEIRFFTSQDLSVAKIHELQEWANSEHSIYLEIFDGQAISELLADPEVYWIAIRYLSMPKDALPVMQTNESDGLYLTLKKSWEDNKKEPINYSDYSELSSGIRYAISNENYVSDIDFWVPLLYQLKENTKFEKLKRCSVYEIAVCLVRSKNTLIGLEEELRGYFESVLNSDDPVEWQDMSVLLNFCIAMYHENNLQLSAEELKLWISKLKDISNKKIETTELRGEKCKILELQGYLELIVIPDTKYKPNIKLAIEKWSELVEILKNYKLYPINDFADYVSKFVHLLGGEEGYEELTSNLDDLVSKVLGGISSAEKSFNRAIHLYNNKNLVLALNELHRAKINSFNQETISDSISAMGFASDIYRELGMSFAAKYYAMAASFISKSSENEDDGILLIKSIITSSSIAYKFGYWLESLLLAQLAFNAMQHVSDRIGEFEVGTLLDELWVNIGFIFSLTHKLEPNISELIDQLTKDWGIDGKIVEFRTFSEKAWSDSTVEEIWKTVEDQLSGPPYSDLGEFREIDFRALGVNWHFKWENTFENTIAAESLISILQILLVDMSLLDLCILPTTVRCEISASDEVSIEIKPDNNESNWVIKNKVNPKLSHEEMELHQTKMLSLAFTLINEISLLKNDELFGLLEKRYIKGLLYKVFVGQPYAYYYHQFTNKEDFANYYNNNIKKQNISYKFERKQHLELSWKDTLGPGYSVKHAKEMLENRYKRGTIQIWKTLQRLKKDPDFVDVVKILREEYDWKDWLLTNSVLSIVINNRITQEGLSWGSQEGRFRAAQLIDEPETSESAVVPSTEFTLEKMLLVQKTGMLTTLRRYNLEFHSRTPDFGAIDKFLKTRYRYYEDDIEHRDLGLPK